MTAERLGRFCRRSEKKNPPTAPPPIDPFVFLAGKRSQFHFAQQSELCIEKREKLSCQAPKLFTIRAIATLLGQIVPLTWPAIAANSIAHRETLGLGHGFSWRGSGSRFMLAAGVEACANCGSFCLSLSHYSHPVPALLMRSREWTASPRYAPVSRARLTIAESWCAGGGLVLLLSRENWSGNCARCSRLALAE